MVSTYKIVALLLDIAVMLNVGTVRAAIASALDGFELLAAAASRHGLGMSLRRIIPSSGRSNTGLALMLESTEAM